MSSSAGSSDDTGSSSSSGGLVYQKGAAVPVAATAADYEVEQAQLRQHLAAQGQAQSVQQYKELPSDADRLKDPAERAAWAERHAARKARLAEALQRRQT